DLIEYQSVRYATEYLDDVLRVWEAEEKVGSEAVVTEMVARNLHKLMAYKDEYEVARFHLAPAFKEQLQATFEGPVRVRYNLHPPFLRRLGRQRKLELGSWFRGVFWVLRSLRGLRGTRFDIFGYQASRREERALIVWYCEVLDR